MFILQKCQFPLAFFLFRSNSFINRFSNALFVYFRQTICRKLNTRDELFFFICSTCADLKICSQSMTFLRKKLKRFMRIRQKLTLKQWLKVINNFFFETNYHSCEKGSSREVFTTQNCMFFREIFFLMRTFQDVSIEHNLLVQESQEVRLGYTIPAETVVYVYTENSRKNFNIKENDLISNSVKYISN